MHGEQAWHYPLSMLGQSHIAVLGEARDPSVGDEAIQQGLAEASRQVRPALGPIHAGPGELAPAVPQREHIDLEILKEPFPLRGEVKPRPVSAKRAAGDEGIRECDAQPPGEVVVAGAGFPEALRGDALR